MRFGLSPSLFIAIQTHKGGRANKMRQKAVALGPTGLRRTKMGAKAMATAPANKATMGQDCRPALIVSAGKYRWRVSREFRVRRKDLYFPIDLLRKVTFISDNKAMA